jgi:hypothetical protein
VKANGVLVGAFTLSGRAVRACIIPATIITSPYLEVVFETPDAARPIRPADGRTLAIAFSAATFYPDLTYEKFSNRLYDSDDPIQVDIDAVMRADRMPHSQLMRQFESLGQNCEFGLVQRLCHAEPLGLLRFASTPLQNLLSALDRRFADVGTPESLRVEISANGREFMVADTTYDIIYHAWVNAGAMTAEELHRREVQRVPLLVRKLLEDLSSGEKIFVFKGMAGMEKEIVFPLVAALRRYGRNTLLHVTLADAEHKAGIVEAQGPGFLVGYLSRFAPGEDAHDLVLGEWINLCRNAYRLAQVMPA